MVGRAEAESRCAKIRQEYARLEIRVQDQEHDQYVTRVSVVDSLGCVCITAPAAVSLSPNVRRQPTCSPLDPRFDELRSHIVRLRETIATLKQQVKDGGRRKSRVRIGIIAIGNSANSVYFLSPQCAGVFG